MFQLVVHDEKGDRHDIGSLKIGQRALEPSPSISQGKRAPTLQPQFEVLTEVHFSLGQDDNYYEALNELGDDLRASVLSSLRDCAYNLSIFDQFRTEDVMSESLLRYISDSQVRQRFHRLAYGNAALTDYYFEYTFSTDGAGSEPPKIAFQVTPLSEPPTNVHVLIGRNGVGKTRCLNRLAAAILNVTEDAVNLGLISSIAMANGQSTFAGLVVVSFSAFDLFQLPPVSRVGIRASRIGMPEPSSTVDPDLASSRDRSFADDFRSALEKCRSGPRLKRIKTALSTLENDPSSQRQMSVYCWRTQRKRGLTQQSNCLTE